MAINFDRKMGPREAQLRALREAKLAGEKAGMSLARPGVEHMRQEIEALQAEVARLKRALAERPVSPGRETKPMSPGRETKPLSQGQPQPCPVCEARRAAERAKKARQRDRGA